MKKPLASLLAGIVLTFGQSSAQYNTSDNAISLRSATIFSGECHLVSDRSWMYYESQEPEFAVVPFWENFPSPNSDVKVAGDPTIGGTLYCTAPREFSFWVANNGDSVIEIKYNVYVDDGDELFEPTEDTIALESGPTYMINPQDTFHSGRLGYLPLSDTKPYSDMGLWIEVIIEGYPNSATYFLSNACLILPVRFGSFTVKRQGASVYLQWETLNEINNSQFQVEKKRVGGIFEPAGTVPSKAPNGNSAYTIVYDYRDLNSFPGMSIYRIAQTDLDGRKAYSESKAVAGLNQGNRHQLSPNPVQDQRLLVVFAEPANSYELSLFDQFGRMLRQWKNYNGNYLDLGNIAPGLYHLKILDRTNGGVENVKLVVAE